jgi:hypothetical protein
VEDLNKIFESQVKKETVFMSEELTSVFSGDKAIKGGSGFQIKLVFKDHTIPIEYIKYENKSSRDKFKGFCNSEAAFKIMQAGIENLAHIEMYFKNCLIKKFNSLKTINFSLTKKDENIYIFKYVSKKEA